MAQARMVGRVLDLLQPLVPGVDLQVVAVFALVVAVVLSFFREWFRTDVTALGTLALVLFLGLLPVQDVVEEGEVVARGLLSVFSNGAPVTIASMFVLSAGLERTGVIDAIGRFFSKVAGRSELRVMLVLMVMAAVLSAFVNNTPVVVVFLPIVLAHARATGLSASRLLIPLSFASILGGTCTLTGTSTNLIIDGVAQGYDQPAFTMFEVTKLGLVYAVIGFIYLVTVGRRLLPERPSLSELLEPEARDFLTQFEVEEGSSLIGKPLTTTLLDEFASLRVLEVRRRGRRLRSSLDDIAVEAGDRLLITIHGTSFAKLQEKEGIRFGDPDGFHLKELEPREMKLIEGIVGARSRLVGRTVGRLALRQNHGVEILAIHRQGVNLRGDLTKVKLAFGDTLLMQGPVEGVNEIQKGRDFVTITEPRQSSDPDTTKLWWGVGLTAAFVLGAALQVLPIPGLAVIVAVGMILARCLTVDEAYDAVQWNIVFLIFGMLGLGLAMEQSGAAALLVDGIMRVCGGFSPVVVLSVIYLLSSFLTEVISNNAVAALLTPIVLGVAESLGVDARPFIVAMMFGCSASFATPVGYQTNTYVYGAGGYRFSDFLKVGLPLNLLLWLAATVLIPLPFFWPFGG